MYRFVNAQTGRVCCASDSIPLERAALCPTCEAQARQDARRVNAVDGVPEPIDLAARMRAAHRTQQGAAALAAATVRADGVPEPIDLASHMRAVHLAKGGR